MYNIGTFYNIDGGKSKRLPSTCLQRLSLGTCCRRFQFIFLFDLFVISYCSKIKMDCWGRERERIRTKSSGLWKWNVRVLSPAHGDGSSSQLCGMPSPGAVILPAPRGVGEEIYGERSGERESVKLRREGWSQESLSTGRAPTPWPPATANSPSRPKSIRRGPEGTGVLSSEETFHKGELRLKLGSKDSDLSYRARWMEGRFFISCPRFMSGVLKA